MSSSDIIRVHLEIRGRVQGVYYRASARQVAMELHVCGWVRNTEDGAVEIAVQGPSEAVAKFMAWCHEGPPLAIVDNVHKDEIAVEIDAPKSFLIRR